MTADCVPMRVAIEGLYAVFARYPLRPHGEGCPCCVSGEDEARLHEKPLREFTSEDLDRFVFKVMSTWGGVGDLKHFLPRMLELLAGGSECLFDHEVMLGKLRVGEWNTWPAEERDAVQMFLDCLWRQALASESDASEVHSVLCGLGNAVDDLSPFLAAWLECRSRTGYERLLAFVEENFQAITKRRHLNHPFWSNAHEQSDQVVEWLLDRNQILTLEEVLMDNGTADYAGVVSAIVDRLTQLQRHFVVED